MLLQELDKKPHSLAFLFTPICLQMTIELRKEALWVKQAVLIFIEVGEMDGYIFYTLDAQLLYVVVEGNIASRSKGWLVLFIF